MHAFPDGHSRAPLPGGDSIQSQLREEIAFLEARLDEMLNCGDCAYEKALVRAYNERLADRRDQLATLASG